MHIELKDLTREFELAVKVAVDHAVTLLCVERNMPMGKGSEPLYPEPLDRGEKPIFTVTPKILTVIGNQVFGALLLRDADVGPGGSGILKRIDPTKYKEERIKSGETIARQCLEQIEAIKVEYTGFEHPAS